MNLTACSTAVVTYNASLGATVLVVYKLDKVWGLSVLEMGFESLKNKVSEHEETSIEDSVIDVVTLMIGGIIGGKAFEVASSNYSLLYELSVYFGLLVIGVICIYFIRLSKPIGEAISEK